MPFRYRNGGRIPKREPEASLSLRPCVNFLKSPANEALYLAQISVATVIGLVVIVLSYRAFRKTRFIGFALWIVSSVLSVSGTLGWDVVGHAYSYPRLYPAAVIVYRVVFVLNSIISAIGTILVIREFVRLSNARELPKSGRIPR